MVSNYLTPLFVSLAFIVCIYLNKLFCKIFKLQNEDASIIIVVSIFTAIAIGYCSQTVCSNSSLVDCLYLKFDLMAIMKVLIGNTILFSTHIFYLGLFVFQKPFNIKAIIVGPIVQQILFRVIYFAVSHQQPNVLYLSFIFSIAHSHHLINLIVTGQTYHINNSIVQLIITFIFGLYSFWILKLTKSVWAVILLHSYCNYLGPPAINSQTLTKHIMSIITFIVYSYFVY